VNPADRADQAGQAPRHRDRAVAVGAGGRRAARLPRRSRRRHREAVIREGDL